MDYVVAVSCEGAGKYQATIRFVSEYSIHPAIPQTDSRLLQEGRLAHRTQGKC